MKKLLSLFLVIASCLSAAAIDVTGHDNIIFFNDARQWPGKQITMPLMMNNTAEITAMQFDLVLPEGITLDKNVKGKYALTFNTETERTDASCHTLSSSLQADGSIRVLCYSTDKEPFEGNSGALIDFPFTVAETAEPGEYSIVLKNILLTTTGKKEYKEDEVVCKLIVPDYEMGDVNGDDAINVTDIVYTADYILENMDPAFNELAADMNEDGDINVTDIVYISDKILEIDKNLVPAIHNKKPNEAGDMLHFAQFTDIYSKGTGQAAVNAVYTYSEYQQTAEKYAYSVAYCKSIDLKEYVTVCDKNNSDKIVTDYANRGLSFEFSIMECFNIQNEGSTDDATNQCKYAKITNGVLTSQSINGITNNRDAVGKTPVVQIILRSNTNNRIVDERYVLIKWTDQQIETETLNAYSAKPVPFDCGETYDVTIGEEYMNNLAAMVNLESSSEFAKMYTFGSTLYASSKLDDEDVYGYVHVFQNGTTTGQADNVVVMFWGDNKNVGKLDDELCETGKKAITGYVKIFNALGMHVYTMPVTLNLTFDKASAINKKYAKINNYWKNHNDLSAVEPDMYVVANPTHEKTGKYQLNNGYQDTQFLYEFLNVYTNADANSPQKAEDLVINLNPHDGDYAQFEFDEKRIQEMMGSTLWNVSEDGLTLMKDQEIAATLTKTGKIQLYENVDNAKNGINGIPSEAAKEFVAYLNDPEKNGIAIQLVAYQCEHRYVLDQFVVRFEKPLKFTALKDEIILADRLSEGSTKTCNLHDVFCLQECFGSMNRIVWGPAHVTDFFTLVNWYKVKPVVDIENATLNGKLLKDYKNQDGSAKYTLIYKEQTAISNASFTFINNSGNAITEDLDIQVEMQITSKWRTWDPITFHVNVLQTTTTTK